MRKIYRLFKAHFLLKYRQRFLATILASFSMFFVFLFAGMLALAFRSVKSYHIPEHQRHPDRYKKVIKEGVFFTSIEYHEK